MVTINRARAGLGMTNVIYGAWSHARTSADSSEETTGRETSEGHSTSSGQRSENQEITSSYLRAVKVLPSSSSRSKKRQSPAAKRPKVAKLTLRASQYAEAQAMRFERSSVSMDADDSRKIPTSQAVSVGNFRLAKIAGKSDKSAMSSPEEVRGRLLKAFEGSDKGPITLALDWGLERNHLREFLVGKKDSLKYEVIESLSEHFGIPISLLIIRRLKKKRKTAA